MEAKRNQMRRSTVSNVVEKQIGLGLENVSYNQEDYDEISGRTFLVE